MTEESVLRSLHIFRVFVNLNKQEEPNINLARNQKAAAQPKHKREDGEKEELLVYIARSE